MAMVTVNGVRLAYEIHGSGDIPLVIVHGSWVSRRHWDPVVPQLAERFRVITYDRRGHGESEPPSGEGSVREDVADLAALVEHLGLAPTWIAAQSFGASISLRFFGERPDLLRGLVAHEPPLFSLIADDPAIRPVIEEQERVDAAVARRIAAGDHAGAAEQFVEEVVGEGLWEQFPPEMKQMCIENAPSYLDEVNDPDGPVFDLDWIRGCALPVLLTFGDQSPPLFAPVIHKVAGVLPSAEVKAFKGAGHIPHAEMPEAYVEAVTAFIRTHERAA